MDYDVLIDDMHLLVNERQFLQTVKENQVYMSRFLMFEPY